MRISVIIRLVLGAATLALSHDEVPEVESVVESILAEYSATVNYAGNPNFAASKVVSNITRPFPLVKGQNTTGGVEDSPYWLAQIKHQGISAFNSDPETYRVFRNVKDFGAKGDGITDDTAAINNAISTGGRCGPGSCQSSTTTPAIVYFPSGTYLISSSIIDYYYSQLIGNPNDLPVLKATANFNGFGFIDGNRYGPDGILSFGSTNVFYRQIRNFIFDFSNLPPDASATGIHWPTAQATSIQSCFFRMSVQKGTQHQGIFIESGSGGFMSDLKFRGGLIGISVGNQQFTMRNLAFLDCVTAINQFWDWGWTYSGISVTNCTTGLNFSSGGSSGQTVGSVTLIDSKFLDTGTAIATAHNLTSSPVTGGSFVLENVVFDTVGTYTPQGSINFQGTFNPFIRSQSLVGDGIVGNAYYHRSKPQYDNEPVSSFLSVRSFDGKGDGIADDTVALNALFRTAAANNQIAFIDAGTYRVTSSIYIPKDSRVVGEAYPVIMGYGGDFINPSDPQCVLCVGYPGDTGITEVSDLVVSTQGPAAGAILIRWNLASPPNNPSGMWDVHSRVGGFAGSKLTSTECPAQPNSTTINPSCIAAFMHMHIPSTASGLYIENSWLWTADHDMDSPSLDRITVYSGRGLYCQSKLGNIWLVGGASEHHTLYQYQFANTKNIFAGQLQTETAYYQPSPNALQPFAKQSFWNDPDFKRKCKNIDGNCAEGWGLRIINSNNIAIYGAGLYSFFNNYSTACSEHNSTTPCQSRIFSIEGRSSNIHIYNLNTIGVEQMITKDGIEIARKRDNGNVFPETVAIFRSE
ncbi:pectate lyase superfamily protein-domain-containing protein [Halenospora varia]|nr:pectate lyase superfamily protein-domain-containing protein [Halenospora varia]